MRNSGAKYVVIVALLVSVDALSLGFAAYSNTLSISASAAVGGDPNQFGVCFSKATNACTAGSVTATLSPASGGPTAASATIPSTDTTKITGLNATFTNALTKKTDGTVTFKSSNINVATVNRGSGYAAGRLPWESNCPLDLPAKARTAVLGQELCFWTIDSPLPWI